MNAEKQELIQLLEQKAATVSWDDIRRKRLEACGTTGLAAALNKSHQHEQLTEREFVMVTMGCLPHELLTT